MVSVGYNTQDIKDITYSKTTFEKGLQLFESRTIRNFRSEEGGRSFYADIKGTKIYDVEVYLDEYGEIEDYYCPCPAFKGYPGPCKHVVAFLLELLNSSSEYRDERKSSIKKASTGDVTSNASMKQYDSEQTRRLLNVLQFELLQENDLFDRVPIQVEFTLIMSNLRYGQRFSLQMRVGCGQLYIVKDCEYVVNSILTGQQVPFGKKFTFSADKHELSAEDRAVFLLLKQVSDSATASGRERRSNEDRKEITLPGSMLKELLEKLSMTPLASFKTNPYQTYGKRILPENLVMGSEKLPIRFDLSELTDGGLLFEETTEAAPENIFFHEADIFLIGGHFYYLTTSIKDRLNSIYAAISQSGHEGLHIPPEAAGDFLAIAVPAMQKFANISLTESVQASYQRYPLQAELYLDWKMERLILELFFRYGETKIDGTKEIKTEKILLPETIVRDRIAEEVLLQKFIESGNDAFQFENSLYLEVLDDIMSFLYEGLEKLAPYCEIFTTAAVENLLYQPVRPPKVAIEVNNQSRLLDVTFRTDEINVEDLKQMVRQIAQNKNYHRLSNGKIVNLRQKEIKELTDAVVQLDVPLKDLKKEMSLPLYKAFGVDTDAGIVHQNEDFMTLINRMEKPEKIDFDLPDDLTATLRPYQETGFKWLKGLDYYGFGGILADDMGLGKTLQIISFIAGSLGERDEKPYLVICPSSVLYNWQKEFQQFAPGIRTQLITGTKSERSDCVTTAIAENIPVWITSYPLLQRDEDLYEGLAFRTVILDEAQSVKNATAKTTKAASALIANNKIAMSGTPIENALSELYTIFSIAQPGLFGTKKDFKQLEPAEIAKKVKPFILRRMKGDVLKDLPPKIESISYIEMTEKQKTVYLSQLQLMRQETKEMLDAKTLNENRIKILAGLTRLRQICCDPALIMADYTGGSGKLERLMEYLAEAKENGRRVVLFSQFTQMLAIIRKKLDETGDTYFYLDGQTLNQDRLTLTTRFNEGEKDLFLISLKAGGTGLNLAGGDTVILYDSWWNPAVESQATDRVHRFGQKKVVQVMRMIATGTIEERINELQEQKREMIDSVIQAGGQSVTSLTKEELMQLLEMQA
ncbi:DEAD/DEAH box helicase [Trichococcus collinsii]|uniref:Superfamily II DNA or RNA helicase, SNF2 family n=1 Tax=Trichococcus collinsii TaxID=157076 RepID=A0AB37ZY45_9LACT|nr:DEAD/DEAH box helicase [Trichococcus collinsii]CZR09508.1 zinc finger swim-type [Trichococcus collinsii]SEA15072.1 Superfamily II DNA or RNA helicase, SNF2 family [Trichococcus collinsii]